MQTFLPYPSFYQSAKVLDDTRLGNQRKEAKQILMVLLGETKHWKNPDAWKNHPAVLMWKGFHVALADYAFVICDEWVHRGFRDEVREWLVRFCEISFDKTIAAKLPDWFNDPRFHDAHKSNLIRKDPNYYGPLFPGVPDNLPYFWPSKEGY